MDKHRPYNQPDNYGYTHKGKGNQYPKRDVQQPIHIGWKEINAGLEGSASEVAAFIDVLGRKVKNEMADVTSSQLRNVYDELKRAITAFEVQKVRIMMLYMSGKSDKKPVKETWAWLERLAGEVMDEKKVSLYHEFWRTLIAIHKFNAKNKTS